MTDTAQPSQSDTLLGVPLPIQFLYWEDCPSHEQALSMLREAIADLGIDVALDITRVDTWEDAERLRFPGSPTIRVNGVDIAEDPGLPIGLTCRIYRRPDGKPAPLPRKEDIVEALRMATLQPQIEEAGGARVEVHVPRGGGQ